MLKKSISEYAMVSQYELDRGGIGRMGGGEDKVYRLGLIEPFQ